MSQRAAAAEADFLAQQQGVDEMRLMREMAALKQDTVVGVALHAILCNIPLTRPLPLSPLHPHLHLRPLSPAPTEKGQGWLLQEGAAD